MIAPRQKNQRRRLRHQRARRHLAGSSQRPRLSVFRSLHHIYAQVIDDQRGATLAAVSSREKALALAHGGNRAAAEAVGRALAARALERGISTVVFDRGGYLYHGRVQALADAARAAGLKF
ncbi:MAG: 50S ribosomal protein L18 [Terriglobales bacterium]